MGWALMGRALMAGPAQLFFYISNRAMTCHGEMHTGSPIGSEDGELDGPPGRGKNPWNSEEILALPHLGKLWPYGDGNQCHERAGDEIDDPPHCLARLRMAPLEERQESVRTGQAPDAPRVWRIAA